MLGIMKLAYAVRVESNELALSSQLKEMSLLVWAILPHLRENCVEPAAKSYNPPVDKMLKHPLKKRILYINKIPDLAPL